MQEILNHPAVQGGVAPFVVGLVATLLFAPARLAGLAAYKADDLKCAQVTRSSVVPGARGCKRGAS